MESPGGGTRWIGLHMESSSHTHSCAHRSSNHWLGITAAHQTQLNSANLSIGNCLGNAKIQENINQPGRQQFATTQISIIESICWGEGGKGTKKPCSVSASSHQSNLINRTSIDSGLAHGIVRIPCESGQRESEDTDLIEECPLPFTAHPHKARPSSLLHSLGSAKTRTREYYCRGMHTHNR